MTAIITPGRGHVNMGDGQLYIDSTDKLVLSAKFNVY